MARLTVPVGEAAEILGQLRGRGLATGSDDTHHLTEDGRLYALQVVRTHRSTRPGWRGKRGLLRPVGTVKPTAPSTIWRRRQWTRWPPGSIIPALTLMATPSRLGMATCPKRRLAALASWPDGRPAKSSTWRTNRRTSTARLLIWAWRPEPWSNSRHLEDGAIEVRIEGRSLCHCRQSGSPDPCRGTGGR
ncbi:MAG: hypothetical protein R3F31_22190 [Verrucomicrobiales bacterium]